jgi:hypothetical protein
VERMLHHEDDDIVRVLFLWLDGLCDFGEVTVNCCATCVCTSCRHHELNYLKR